MLQAELCISILRYMIYQCVSDGRVGSSISLSDHRKWLNCPNTTFYRAVNTLKKNGMIRQVSRDRYMLGLWSIDLVESWGN